MANGPEVCFEVRPADSAYDGWCVHVFWPKGNAEILTGFSSQYNALDWIKSHSSNWAVEKIMSDPKY